jgi:hypothetical protein
VFKLVSYREFKKVSYKECFKGVILALVSVVGGGGSGGGVREILEMEIP